MENITITIVCKNEEHDLRRLRFLLYDLNQPDPGQEDQIESYTYEQTN